jgi:hypothetical protein
MIDNNDERLGWRSRQGLARLSLRRHRSFSTHTVAIVPTKVWFIVAAFGVSTAFPSPRALSRPVLSAPIELPVPRPYPVTEKACLVCLTIHKGDEVQAMDSLVMNESKNDEVLTTELLLRENEALKAALSDARSEIDRLRRADGSAKDKKGPKIKASSSTRPLVILETFEGEGSFRERPEFQYFDDRDEQVATGESVVILEPVTKAPVSSEVATIIYDDETVQWCEELEDGTQWCDELEDGSCPVEPTISFTEALRDRSYWLVGLLMLQSFSGIILARNEALLAEHPVSK